VAHAIPQRITPKVVWHFIRPIIELRETFAGGD
jgi:hypothetical protein